MQFKFERMSSCHISLYSHYFIYLGEAIKTQVDNVLYFNSFSCSEMGQRGRISVTNFRITFNAYKLKDSPTTVQVLKMRFSCWKLSVFIILTSVFQANTGLLDESQVSGHFGGRHWPLVALPVTRVHLVSHHQAVVYPWDIENLGKNRLSAPYPCLPTLWDGMFSTRHHFTSCLPSSINQSINIWVCFISVGKS